MARVKRTKQKRLYEWVRAGVYRPVKWKKVDPSKCRHDRVVPTGNSFNMHSWCVDCGAFHVPSTKRGKLGYPKRYYWLKPGKPIPSDIYTNFTVTKEDIEWEEER